VTKQPTVLQIDDMPGATAN